MIHVIICIMLTATAGWIVQYSHNLIYQSISDVRSLRYTVCTCYLVVFLTCSLLLLVKPSKTTSVRGNAGPSGTHYSNGQLFPGEQNPSTLSNESDCTQHTCSIIISQGQTKLNLGTTDTLVFIRKICAWFAISQNQNRTWTFQWICLLVIIVGEEKRQTVTQPAHAIDLPQQLMPRSTHKHSIMTQLIVFKDFFFSVRCWSLKTRIWDKWPAVWVHHLCMITCSLHLIQYLYLYLFHLIIYTRLQDMQTVH